MNQAGNNEPFTRWYQEPWAWYIVGIILVTMLWGSFQVYVAFKNADEVVVDDYYKVGKAINQDLGRDQRAAQQNIAALLEILPQSHTLKATLTGTPESWPRQLRLRLMPAARDQQAQTIALLQSPHSTTLYTGRSQDITAGRYYLQLETLDELTPEQGYLSGWRLNREVVIEAGTPVRLSAN